MPPDKTAPVRHNDAFCLDLTRHKRELCSTRAHPMRTHRNSRKLHGGGRGRRRLQRSVIDLHVQRDTHRAPHASGTMNRAHTRTQLSQPDLEAGSGQAQG